jgi:hypothetical protein
VTLTANRASPKGTEQMKRDKRRRTKKKKPRKVYHDTKVRYYDPVSATKGLTSLYPDAPFWDKDFCPGCNKKKSEVKSINVSADRNGKVKALYTLCPSCVRIALHGTDAAVNLLNRRVKKNLKAWLPDKY